MNAAIALKSIASLSVLWFFIVYLWRDYRLDSFRDHVFSIRDRLFLYAANGNVDFEDPAYGLLRDRMNVVLRYAHEFTLTRMFIILATHDRTKSTAIVKWEQAVEALREPTRSKVKEFNTCFAVAVLQHMVFGSFFLYVVLRPLMLFLNPFQVREVAERPQLVSGVEGLESDALEQDARRMEHEVAVAV